MLGIRTSAGISRENHTEQRTANERLGYEHEIEHGSLYIGSPETVAQKIARSMKILGAERFDLVYGTGPLSASARLRNVELFGSQVIPRVRELLRDQSEIVAPHDSSR